MANNADFPFLFGPDGPLALALAGFKPREVQARMAEEVASALEDGELRFIEAGTGTGKTFAYLVPALLAGRRIVVSTGTKNLQDQLFERDLPRLLGALKVGARVAMLKGRANYLCLYRMKRAAQELPLRVHPGARSNLDDRLRRVQGWARSTERGEVSELGRLIEDDRFRFQVTSTADNCLGAKCPDFGPCFVAKARRAAMGADLVVVNHHVLLADVLLKEEGFGEILPGADAVVVDEAHQLPDLAGQFFGTRISTRQLRDIGDAAMEAAHSQGDVPSLYEAAMATAEPLIEFEGRLESIRGRVRLTELASQPAFADCVTRMGDALEALTAELAAFHERSEVLEALHERAKAILERFRRGLDVFAEDEHVRWAEPLMRGGVVNATPLDLGPGFDRVFAAHPGAWILTSATLSAGGDFSYVKRQFGQPEARALALDSPFDFARQARLHLPSGMPEPSDPVYTDRVADVSLELIQASAGGVFVLCTSHRALRQIAAKLRAALDPSIPLFVHGDDDRARLVERFAQAGNGVLVGTHSFWEGVDVKGPALRVVIIDKLPFASPGDPVYDARLEAIRRRGGNPFTDVQLPEAIVSLRQGIGRLIRDELDQGLLVLCDPRLRSKSYGRKILQSLPAMPMVDRAQAREWAEALQRHASA